MNFKELIAGLLSLLVTGATFAFAASAATTLDQYPGFLASNGQLNAYVVIGSGGTDPAGLASDVAGAVDIAVRFAELQYAKTTVSGTSANVNGLERDIAISGADTQTVINNGFPSQLRDFHFSGLQTGKVNFRGTDYNYHEAVVLGSGVKLDHTYATSNVNGTEKLTMDTNKPVEYRFYFDDNITGLGTTASPSYTNTLTLNILGTPFVITGVGTDGFKALVGTYGLADSKTPVVNGGYSIYALDGASGVDGTAWAKIQIKDASGNVLVTDSLYQGTDTKTYTLGGTAYKVKVTGVFASTITNTVSAQVVFGSDVDKTYPSTADQGSTHNFIGTTDWYVYGTGFGAGFTNSGANSYIGVVYWPQQSQYMLAGTVFKAPNDYFELGYTSWNIAKFATITIERVTGQSIYSNVGDTSPAGSNLNGFMISSDTKGTITYDGTNWWNKVYVLFNGTGTADGSVAKPFTVWVGHWYDSGSKILNDSTTSGADKTVNFTVSYGSAQSVNYYLIFPYTNATAALGVPYVYQTSTPAVNVSFDYVFDSKTANPPTFKMGPTASSAEDIDIYAAHTGGYDTIGKASQDIVTNAGVIVLAPNGYTSQDKGVFQIPSDVLKAHVAFGKIGATVTTGGTYYAFNGPVLSPVAKLDKDMSTADKAAKDLIVVGGPCVNSLAADVLGVTYPACGPTSTLTQDTAIIKVVDGQYASGQQVVLVAGWEAVNTRTAADVLQNYDQPTVSSQLVGKSMVTITGTSVSTATIS